MATAAISIMKETRYPDRRRRDLSDSQIFLDIRMAEFPVLPMQGDRIDMPFHAGVRGGAYEVLDLSGKGNAGGMITMTLRSIEPSKPIEHHLSRAAMSRSLHEPYVPPSDVYVPPIISVHSWSHAIELGLVARMKAIPPFNTCSQIRLLECAPDTNRAYPICRRVFPRGKYGAARRP